MAGIVIDWLVLETNGSCKRASQPGVTDAYEVGPKDRICLFAKPEDGIANFGGGRYKKPRRSRSPAAPNGVEFIRHCRCS